MPFTLKPVRMSFSRFALGAVACLGLSSLLFSGCSTDLDPNADYKEVTVIYSVLNPSEKIHYVKVTKAFQNTNADARNIASTQPDSMYYKAEEMQVKLQKLKADSTVLAEYPLVRIDTAGKEPGTFFSDRQILYRTPSVTLDDQAIYRVIATNTRTGNVARAATPLVQEGRFCVYQVSIAATFSGVCYTETNLSKYEPQIKSNFIKFTLPSNAYIYSARIDFDYTETTNGVTQNKTTSWYVRSNFLQSPNNADPFLPISFQVEDNLFYNNLLNLIDTSNDNNTTTRKAGVIRTTVTAGSQNLAKYYQVNNSFSVFSQVRPEFDNVSNGTGLVASRLQKVAGAELTAAALQVLKTDPKYLKLKFQ
jgi:hypothetical protein